jgi:VanZ family protein
LRRLATAFWIGLTFFSSTTVAAQWSEQAYKFFGSISSAYLKTDFVSSGMVHFLAEKSVHVFLCIVLAILLWNSIPVARRKFTSILFVGCCVGLCSELLQRLFPGRDPALRDAGIDVAATIAGALISWFLFRSKREATTHDDLYENRCV